MSSTLGGGGGSAKFLLSRTQSKKSSRDSFASFPVGGRTTPVWRTALLSPSSGVEASCFSRAETSNAWSWAVSVQVVARTHVGLPLDEWTGWVHESLDSHA